MPVRTVSQDVIDLIADMREDGMSYGAIARELNIKEKTVGGICLELGVDSPDVKPDHKAKPALMVTVRNGYKVRRFTPEEDALMVKLDGEGLGPKQIADAVGRNHSSVINRMRTLARREERKLAEAA